MLLFNVDYSADGSTRPLKRKCHIAESFTGFSLTTSEATSFIFMVHFHPSDVSQLFKLDEEMVWETAAYKYVFFMLDLVWFRCNMSHNSFQWYNTVWYKTANTLCTSSISPFKDLWYSYRIACHRQAMCFSTGYGEYGFIYWYPSETSSCIVSTKLRIRVGSLGIQFTLCNEKPIWVF